jgi:hypothetical protein
MAVLTTSQEISMLVEDLVEAVTLAGAAGARQVFVVAEA